ncbi:MAG: rhodanese-like domain-containing protein [Calditrichaeota bacterium]|nr:rhodanese-like domain-containing protein [Calditrichota bacterium]
MKEITALDLKNKLDNREDFILVDVRRPDELTICKIDGSMHIEMNDIPAQLDNLDQAKEYVIYCRSGMRSANVVHFMTQNNFDATNLKGGILAWIDDVEPNKQKY